MLYAIRVCAKGGRVMRSVQSISLWRLRRLRLVGLLIR